MQVLESRLQNFYNVMMTTAKECIHSANFITEFEKEVFLNKKGRAWVHRNFSHNSGLSKEWTMIFFQVDKHCTEGWDCDLGFGA